MPDLMLVTMQQCTEGLTNTIGGYEQLVLGYGEGHCTCKGFKFRYHCKHLEQAITEKCSYHEQVDGPPVKDGVCPKCGGSTEYVRVGV